MCVGASGCATQTQELGGSSGILIVFTPVAGNSVNANPSTSGLLGQITVSCVAGGTTCGSQSLAGLNLFVNLDQTVPSVGTAGISAGVFTGSISGSTSTAQITWSVPNTRDIGSVSYSILNNPIDLLAPAAGGVVQVQGTIIDTTAVPEPASYALVAGGIALMAIRRRRVSR